jgi:hypothetical protein
MCYNQYKLNNSSITKDVWTKAEEHIKNEKEYCKENCIDRSVIELIKANAENI